MLLGINQDLPFFPLQCHVRFLLISILYIFFSIPVFLFLKCAHSKQSRRVSLQFAFFILPLVRHTKSLRWLRTLKRKEKFNFLNNPLAGTSGPDDTRHMLRVIKYGISDLLHLEATRIGPGLLENWLHAAAILLEELLGMLFRLNAFSLCLPWLCWLAFSSEYVSTVSSQFG